MHKKLLALSMTALLPFLGGWFYIFDSSDVLCGWKSAPTPTGTEIPVGGSVLDLGHFSALTTSIGVAPYGDTRGPLWKKSGTSIVEHYPADAGNARYLMLEVSPSSITANGSSTCAINVTLIDGAGSLISDVLDVTLSSTRGLLSTSTISLSAGVGSATLTSVAESVTSEISVKSTYIPTGNVTARGKVSVEFTP